MNNHRLETYSPLIQEIVAKSGEIIRSGFDGQLQIKTKNDLTPLTQVDTDVNRYVMDRLAEEFPNDDFAGEEGCRVNHSERLWICDPLDGTRPFINGLPLGTFALALVENKQVVLSVIHDPFMNRTIYSAKGEGAWQNGQRLEVSKQASLDGADIHTCWGSTESGYLRRIDNLRKVGSKVIKMDATVYAGMLVSNGKLDGDIYPGKHPWDAAAQSLAVIEAGGRVTDINGDNIDFSQDSINGAVITNGKIHDKLIELILRSEIE